MKIYFATAGFNFHRNHERHLSAIISGTRHFDNINYYIDLQEAQKILRTELNL